MPAALVAAAFVVVALVASDWRIDASVLIWTAMGVFGLVFGIATVSSARHADKAATPAASTQAHASRVAAGQAPLVRAATAAMPVAHAATAQSGPGIDMEGLRALAIQGSVEAEPELARRMPKHSAELPA